MTHAEAKLPTRNQDAGFLDGEYCSQYRVKYLLREIDKRTSTGTETLLSMRQGKGLIPHNDVSKKRFKSEELVGYKITCPGQLVMNRMRASIGLFAASHTEGLVSPDYAVFQPLKPVNLDYLVHLFRTPIMGAIFRRESKGMGTGSSGFLRLYTDRFGAIPISIPHIEEQNKIVAFIKGTEKEISRFIRNKRRLIELLKEQKQNVINQAVTRGLDPNVKLKPSGVEWIGDIPEHWEMVPLKRLAIFKGGTGFPHVAQGKSGLELPFYKVSDMTLSGNETYMINTNNSITRETASSLGATIFPENTIVFPKVGGAMLTNKRRILTRLSCIDNNIMGCVLQSDTVFDFLFLRLQTLNLGLIRKPGPVPAIGEGEVRSFRVPLPPKGEQLQIVEHVKVQTTTIDQAINRAQREIELMREYRTRLISDVVTGQVDVRGIEVPEIAEEELLMLDDDTVESDDTR